MPNEMQKDFNEIKSFVKLKELAAAEERSNNLDHGRSVQYKRGIFGQMIDSGLIANPRAEYLQNSQQLRQAD